MSSQNTQATQHSEESTGKASFRLSELVTLLEGCEGLVRLDHLRSALTKSDGHATDEDWKKFYAAITDEKIKAPVDFLVEPTLSASDESSRSTTATVIAAIALAITIAEKLWSFFSGFDDKEGRSRWTADLVRELYAEDPRWNYVVCYTRHQTNFNGVKGVDWDVRTYNYKLKIGSVSYQLYLFRAGTFTLHGDGGFLNWAFIGRVLSRDPDSKRPRHIVFGNP